MPPSNPSPATAFASEIPGLLVTPGQAPAFSPLYQQIKGLILQSLQSGEWKPGEAIPSEMDLAARFKVSQGTVRKAIDELATENLLVRRQGKGTFVATHAEERFQFRFLKLQPDHGNPQSQGPAQRTILACKRLRASAEVARALALQPKIMLLDEVMAGLNQSEVGQAIELLQGLHTEGLTFLIIEHNLKVVRAFSERVVVLDRGRHIAEGSADEILNAPAVIQAYLGDGHMGKGGTDVQASANGEHA